MIQAPGEAVARTCPATVDGRPYEAYRGGILRHRMGAAMRIAVRIAGLAAAVALVLWCTALAARSFEPQAGAGLPRLDGGAGLQAALGVAALVTAGLVAVAVVALTRLADRDQHLWPVVCLLGWAALAVAVATHATQLFLAPEDPERGIGAGVASDVAPAWQAYFWTAAALCAALAGALLTRWALAGRSAEETRLEHSLRR